MGLCSLHPEARQWRGEGLRVIVGLCTSQGDYSPAMAPGEGGMIAEAAAPAGPRERTLPAIDTGASFSGRRNLGV